jgi:hypothetical protein
MYIVRNALADSRQVCVLVLVVVVAAAPVQVVHVAVNTCVV